MHITDIRELDARAVEASVRVVSALEADELDLSTPCAGWTLGELLGHMIAQHHGFAAAAAGAGAEPGAWRVEPLGDDPAASYAAAAKRVIAAFAAPGVLERDFAIPDIPRQPAFAAPQAIGFHLVDYVVHGWDVARSLDVGVELDAEVLRAALDIARAVPDGPSDRGPGAAFGPSVRASAGAPTLDRIVALLGRLPDWSP